MESRKIVQINPGRDADVGNELVDTAGKGECGAN